MAKYFRVLSIDGGGIRGIIPGQILVTVEDKLRKKTGDRNTKIGDYFDLIAGTSTGGILTCLYLCPGEKNAKKPKFNAEQAVELYLERGDEIFDISLWQKITSVGGIVDEKYSADELESALKDYFKDLKLSKLIKPCLIPSYDIKRREAHFFNQMNAIANDKDNFLIRDVARATSAAPTYFEVARIMSDANIPYPLIDGGVFANNPALCAYAEVRKKFKTTAKDMVVLSLGTGHIKHNKSYSYKEAKDWGKAEWILPLIDIMMSGVSDTVDYQLHMIFDSVGKTNQYLRINEQLIHAGPEMDNVSSENLNALRQDGTESAQKFDKQLDAIVNLITKQ